MAKKDTELKRVVRAAKYAAYNRENTNFALSRVQNRVLEQKFNLTDDQAWDALDLAERFDFPQQTSIAELITDGVTPAV